MYDNIDSWTKNSGRAISLVTWSDTETEQGRVLEATPEQNLTLRADDLGDRLEVWVSVERNGVETARHNARMIESIIWKDS